MCLIYNIRGYVTPALLNFVASTNFFFSVVSPEATKMISVPIESSFALDYLIFFCTIECRTQTNTRKSLEKELRHLDFYRASIIIYFTRTIIFTVLVR